MKKSLLLLFLVSLLQVNITAQISYGGTPPSFIHKTTLRANIDPLKVPLHHIDFSEIKRQNAIAEENGSPTAIAAVIPIEDVNIATSGEWTILPNAQRIWRQAITAEDAVGIILSYKEFYIPEGGQLFIYNKDHTHILGAYTKATNPRGGSFSTQFTLGDEVILEYVESNISDEQPRIIVEDIGYIYNRDDNTTLPNYNPTVGNSPSCMININCEEGEKWQDQKRGVVMIFSKAVEGSNWYMCSGSLINNTETPGIPYVITANHCFYDIETGAQQTHFDIAQYYFNYEWEECTSPRLNLLFNILPSTIRCIVGSTSLIETNVRNGADGQLVLLDNNVPEEWSPYFNGWDISAEGPQKGVVIHHPQGDAKKISTYEGNRGSSRFNYARNRYWWELGYMDTENGRSVTAGGSSGSPLFNEKGLIVGTLTGGASECEYRNGIYNPDGSDFFGKMWAHWDQIEGSSTNTQMKIYLDPINSGITQLQGYDPNPNGYNPSPNSIESEAKNNKVNIIIFPNPASEEININTRSIINEIMIADMNGRIIYRQDNYKSSTLSVPVSSWQKGIYNVIVKTDEGIFSEKLIKE